MRDYYASVEDIAHDLEDADQQIQCPVLLLWEEDFGAGGRLFGTDSYYTRDSPRACLVTAEG
jgi:hypothetical protein